MRGDNSKVNSGIRKNKEKVGELVVGKYRNP